MKGKLILFVFIYVPGQIIPYFQNMIPDLQLALLILSTFTVHKQYVKTKQMLGDQENIIAVMNHENYNIKHTNNKPQHRKTF